MRFDLQQYLERIGISAAGHAGQGWEQLARLQSTQMMSIPFENIDPLLGRLPDLSPDAVWQKLVVQGRGGYCLELNALFGQALATLEYPARPVLGRVRMGAAQGGPRAHLAWVVSLDDREWLADCGFGGPAPRVPIALDASGQSDGSARFRVRLDRATGERVLEREISDDWFALYGFDDVTPWPVDIEAANVVCSRWEQSPFPGNLLATRLTADGRVSLFNREGKTEAGGAIEPWRLDSANELGARLRHDFGLHLSVDECTQIWSRLGANPASSDTVVAMPDTVPLRDKSREAVMAPSRTPSGPRPLPIGVPQP